MTRLGDRSADVQCREVIAVVVGALATERIVRIDRGPSGRDDGRPDGENRAKG